jgi:hypothetical protein
LTWINLPTRAQWRNGLTILGGPAMTTIPLELHQAEREHVANESGELTEVQMSLVTGFGLLAIMIPFMIAIFSMALLK